MAEIFICALRILENMAGYYQPSRCAGLISFRAHFLSSSYSCAAPKALWL
jgi:hypothetical protein